MSKDLSRLPDDLPRPLDDGAGDHLTGMRVPDIALAATTGGSVVLSELPGRTVVYGYPRTGLPGKPSLVDDWDAIPGARGCTPQSCGFRDHHDELSGLDARVFGLSTQDTAYQREVAERLHLPFPLLSDASLALSRAMALPAFIVADVTLLRRIGLILRDGIVEHVFYPVFPPDRHADEVVAWLTDNAGK